MAKAGVPARVAKPPRELIADLRAMIEEARSGVARAVNSALVGLYWNIGKRIRDDILHQRRAEYGEQIVYALSRQLTAEKLHAAITAARARLERRIENDDKRD